MINLEIIAFFIFLMILVSIQYTLNKILYEIKLLRKTIERESYKKTRDD